MKQSVHIDIDYHKGYSHMVAQDQQGKQLKSAQMGNRMDCVKKFLAPFSEQKTYAVVEATRNWTVMYDWLEEICDDVVLANPLTLKVKAIAEAKIKTDKIDSTILAHLLRADLMPTAHVPGKFTRELRTAFRQRMYFVSMRTMLKNRIHTVFDRYPDEIKRLKPQTDLFGKAGREQLKQIKLSEIDRILVDREWDFIDEPNKYIKAVKGMIKDLVNTNVEVNRLISIPGIGPFTSWLLVAELDDIKRCRNAKKLAAYAGLVPSIYSSGGKRFHGSVIKGGSKYIRWAMIEAIMPIIRVDEELREDYKRIKAKKGYNKANVAVARKLLNCLSCSKRKGCL